MEFGYKNPMTFLLQLKTSEGETTHQLIEAGSQKQAEKKLKQKMDNYQKGKVVTNTLKTGGLGQLGDGELPQESHDLEQLIETLKEEREE